MLTPVPGGERGKDAVVLQHRDRSRSGTKPLPPRQGGVSQQSSVLFPMHLLISTPIAVVADYDDVISVRAEDASGSFGILDGHADLLTALELSVVAWRNSVGQQRYCAVRRGVLSVRGGRQVAIATRQAQLSDDLDQLEHAVIDRLQAEADAERAERVSTLRLHTQAIRQIVLALRGAPPAELAS
jgi:F-type H+-transporting ATPase subunit epsilon